MDKTKRQSVGITAALLGGAALLGMSPIGIATGAFMVTLYAFSDNDSIQTKEEDKDSSS
jgi:hypothetical protein